jgi:hypothetical protein
MNWRKFLLSLIISILMLGALVGFWRVPQQETEWTKLVRLSSENRKASEASVLSDPYGYVHVFWAEENEDESVLILYTRYDGETWSFPVDIYLSAPERSVDSIAPYIDAQGLLHVMWAEGPFPKLLYYASAPVWQALSSSKWSSPKQIRIQAEELDFIVDAEGVYHIAFSMNTANNRGLFYSQSTDNANTWSTPVWFDPDIPTSFLPAKITLALDDTGGMHVTWTYKGLDFGVEGDWVRYIRSLDGGQTWGEPFTIAKNSAGDDELNNFASPVMVIHGQTIHVVWAGGDLLYRHYRFSPDAGNTWSDTTRMMGDLNGQAGDGMAIDALGRPHYFAQIRFPMGVYHSFLDQEKWSFPQLIYFIRFGNELTDYVEAHATYPAIRLGNQIVLTFAHPPSEVNRGLFVMTTILDDVPALDPVPFPLPTATPTPEPLPSESIPPSPTATRSPANVPGEENFSSTQLGSSNPGLVWGLLVSIVIVGGALVFRHFVRE